MAENQQLDDFTRADANAELTRVLMLGFGVLTIKVHGHKICALETTTRKTRVILAAQNTEPRK